MKIGEIAMAERSVTHGRRFEGGRRSALVSENSWSSLGSDWGPNLEDRSPPSGESPSRKAHLDDDLSSFLFRFTFLAAILLLALLIEYSAH